MVAIVPNTITIPPQRELAQRATEQHLREPDEREQCTHRHRRVQDLLPTARNVWTHELHEHHPCADRGETAEQEPQTAAPLGVVRALAGEARNRSGSPIHPIRAYSTNEVIENLFDVVSMTSNDSRARGVGRIALMLVARPLSRITK